MYGLIAGTARAAEAGHAEALQQILDHGAELLWGRRASIQLAGGVVDGTLDLLPKRPEGLVHPSCERSKVLHHIREGVAAVSPICTRGPVASERAWAAGGVGLPSPGILFGLQRASKVFVRARLLQLGRRLTVRPCGR